MSLQVWLPLTKDLRQQGLSNVTVTNNGATYSSTGGKLGGCYIFDGVDDAITVGNLSTLVTDNFSFACWFYHDDTWSSKNYETIFGGPSGFELEAKSGSTNSPVIRAYSWGQGTFTYELNKWNHLVMTRTTSETKFYLNGELKLTGTAGTIPSGNYFVGSWSNTTGQNFKGKVNDVRIYDHCLSPMEVKELAKGLVLHYPLNRQGWGQENLIKNTDFGGVSQKYTVTSGTEGGFTYTPTETITANTEYIVSCRLRGNANMNLYKLCTGGNEALNWVNRSQLSTTEYRPFSIVFTYPSNKTLNQIYICTRYGTASTSVGDWFEIEPYSLKLEKGSIATPWCPNSVDALATTMGLNSTTEYDCSGFCNNGIRTGTFTWTSDTPKYNVSIGITAGGGIFTPMNITFSQYTIAFWAKHTVGSKMLMGSCPSAGSAQTSWYWYGDNSFKYPSGEYYYTYNGGAKDSFKWTHFIATYDGANVRVYRNGVSEGSKACTGDQAMAYLSVGYGYGSSYTENSNMSDFRIYATALSASDVKSLYQNCATIDPDGTIRGQIRS